MDMFSNSVPKFGSEAILSNFFALPESQLPLFRTPYRYGPDVPGTDQQGATKMKTFDVQSIGIDKPAAAVFAYIAEPSNLPKWTHAFQSADATSAELVTPNGAVPISLQTISNEDYGTVDWQMTFPDGTVGTAYSRVTPDGADRAIYSFVLMAPPVPLEMLEGALSSQMEILAGELVALKGLLEG